MANGTAAGEGALACDRACDRRCRRTVARARRCAILHLRRAAASEPPATAAAARHLSFPVLRRPGIRSVLPAAGSRSSRRNLSRRRRRASIETPPASTVDGDRRHMADWLAYGLEEALSDTPEIGSRTQEHPADLRPHCATTRRTIRSSGRQAVKDILATEKPSAIVVMLGLNDRLPFRDKAPPKPGRSRPRRQQRHRKRKTRRRTKTHRYRGSLRRSEAKRRATVDRRQRAAAPRAAGNLSNSAPTNGRSFTPSASTT